MTRFDGRLKILLSEGSSVSARQVLFGLGRDYTVDIVDPSPWCQCRFSSLVRRWHRCPVFAKDPAEYVAFTADLLHRHRYDVLFPTHDQVYVFSKFREAFRQHVGLAVPEFEAICRLQSKAEFVQLLDELNLPFPVTHIVRSERELRSWSRFPCYLKLDHSTASRGVRLVRDRDELGNAIHQLDVAGLWSERGELLMQEPVQGRLSVVNAVFQEGKLVAAACSEILETGIGGGPSLRVSASHPVVVEHVRQLGAYLNLHGPLLLDYFYDQARQQPQYIEANPRIGDTVNAKLCGVDLCELVVKISLGRAVDELPPARAGIKTHNGFIVLLTDAYNGANRRQLLRRLWHGWTGQGAYGQCESEMTRPREDWGSLIPAAAVSIRLLAFPRSARRLSKNTIDNYSLSESAAARIQEMDGRLTL